MDCLQWILEDGYLRGERNLWGEIHRQEKSYGFDADVGSE